jgi:hypothetical protein
MPVSTLEAKSLYICFFLLFFQRSNLNSKIKEEKEDTKTKKNGFEHI